jgi:Cdc6-like AAA superfamily ATPase
MDLFYREKKSLYVVVVDEMDLIPKKQMAQVFRKATSEQSRVVLIGISNTTSDIIPGALKLVFPPYTQQQLLAIAEKEMDPDLRLKFQASQMHTFGIGSSFMFVRHIDVIQH